MQGVRIIILIIAVFTLAACQSLSGDAEHLKQLSVRQSVLIDKQDYPIHQRIVFDALVDTLRQAGYQVQQQDFQRGQILAQQNLTETINRADNSTNQVELNASVRALSPRLTQVTIKYYSLYQTRDAQTGQMISTRQLLKQHYLYDEIFKQLRSAIAMREPIEQIDFSKDDANALVILQNRKH